MSQQCMRVFSTAFKESAVLRLGAGERLAEVARELGIARKLLYEWRAAYRRFGIRPKPTSPRIEPARWAFGRRRDGRTNRSFSCSRN